MSLEETTEITSEDQDALRNAVKSLERPSLAEEMKKLALTRSQFLYGQERDLIQPSAE